MLRPFSSRQLSLVAGDDLVVVFAALGGRRAGPSMEVHAPTLARRIGELARAIETVVFVDEPVPDAALVGLVDDMVAELAEVEVDALAQPAPVTEAVKQVAGGRVTAGIPRSSLVAASPPEVIRRAALERAVPAIGARLWVNPFSLVAAAGARVAFSRPRLETPA